MGAFVITLREAFEASLVLGLVFAFLNKTGQRERHGAAVWQGTVAAIVLSIVVGGALFAIFGELDGSGEAIFEGTAMLFACVVLTWMLFWMRAQARTIGGHLRSQVGQAVATGGGVALASVAFVAVAREGIETALFLFVSVGDSGVAQTVIGGGLGLAAAVVLGVLLYRGSIKLDLKRFFLVTGLLVIAFAAYLLVAGLHEFAEAGGGEALDAIGVAAAVLFALGFGRLYVRDSRTPAPVPAQPVS